MPLSAEYILRYFKNGSTRARVDQYDEKLVFCMQNLFLGFIIPLIFFSEIFHMFVVLMMPAKVSLDFCFFLELVDIKKSPGFYMPLEASFFSLAL